MKMSWFFGACGLIPLWLVVATLIVSKSLAQGKRRMRAIIADDAIIWARENLPDADRMIAAEVVTIVWDATAIPLEKIRPGSFLARDLRLNDIDGLEFEVGLDRTFGIRMPKIGPEDTLEKMINFVSREVLPNQTDPP
ncbi:MAG: hypothetical protein ACI8UO_004892 [Verrucomicrobiales bacterium]|jgi:hypothetical protein